MKRVLIVYSISHQTPLMKSVMANVSDNTIVIDAVDMEKYVYYKGSDQLSISLFWQKIFAFQCDIPYIRNIVNLILEILHLYADKHYLKKIFEEYDIIDFHYFSRQQYPLIKMAYKKNKKIKINLWGSDLFRVRPRDKRFQAEGYKLADQVQLATNLMYEKLIKDYPDLTDKTKIAMFGNSVLKDNLDYLKLPVNTSFLKNYRSSDGKIVITCGYNGSRAQQHSLIIENINLLPSEIKSRLHLIIPMTYGASPEYVKEISNHLTDQIYSYDIVDYRLDGVELYNMRKITDITVNMQVTDAFSGSLQEHIQCGNVLLVGEWLPYNILKENNIYYLTTSVAELQSNIMHIIKNLREYKQKCENNKERIYNLTSWEALAPKWRQHYLSI